MRTPPQTLRGIAEQRCIAVLSASKCNHPILNCTGACHGICHVNQAILQQMVLCRHMLAMGNSYWNVCFAPLPSCIQSTGLSLLALVTLIMMLWLSALPIAVAKTRQGLACLGLRFLWNSLPSTKHTKANLLPYWF